MFHLQLLSREVLEGHTYVEHRTQASLRKTLTNLRSCQGTVFSQEFRTNSSDAVGTGVSHIHISQKKNHTGTSAAHTYLLNTEQKNSVPNVYVARTFCAARDVQC